MEQSPERQSEHAESPIAKSHHAPAADAKERIEEAVLILIAKCTPPSSCLRPPFSHALAVLSRGFKRRRFIFSVNPSWPLHRANRTRKSAAGWPGRAAKGDLRMHVHALTFLH